MELTIRDWMVIIGAGLILAVLVDAARRVWRERRSEVRLNARIKRSDEGEEAEDESFNLLSELPNGGARIVTRDDLMPPEGVPVGTHGDSRNIADDDAIPPPEFIHPEPRLDALNPADLDVSDIDERRHDSSDVPADEPAPVADATHADIDDELNVPSFSALDDDELFDAPEKPVAEDKTAQKKTVKAAAEAPATLDWLDQLDEPEPEEEPEARLPRGIDPHVFVLNVISRDDQGFAGRDIMQILLACDLRFGDMDFFHRHEQSAGRGPIQFSVCNMLKPGVFDIDAMDNLRTRGLMFFVTLPGPEDMLKAFDYMYETAKAVAKNLNGDVLDETRSAITRQSLEHMRQQIRELERRVAMESRR